MRIKELLIRYKKLLIIAVLFIVILLAWNLINSFSELNDSSAWDGVIARDFASGTGTVENPYVISSASEFGLFKSLLEGDDASLYATKNYIITNSFNFGEHDIYIDNEITFSGVIDGNYHTISNAKIENTLFNSLNGATIKNIAFKDIQYNLDEENGAILSNNATNSVLQMVIVTGDVTTSASTKFGGIVYSSIDTEYSNIILNYAIESESTDVYKFAYEIDDATINNVLVNNDGFNNVSGETDILLDKFNVTNGQIVLSNTTDLADYDMVIVNNEFIFVNNEVINENEENGEVNNNDTGNGNDSGDVGSGSKGPSKAPVRGTQFSSHATGLDGTTLYINDLDADYNYFKGLNYTEIRNTSIPSGISTGYYDDSYLVKVELIYDGAGINDSTLVGAVSPIGENANKYVYYKYYALERSASGTLATNSNGNNYIRVELIDNPYSKRPYVTSGASYIEYGFNGWVCNDEGDASPNICDNVTMRFDKTTYTRYMDVEVAGGSEIVIYLNASWHTAKVVTTAASISTLSSMAMVQLPTHNVQVTVHHEANPYWKQNYTTMIFDRTYVRNDGYMPSGSWYKTNQNSSSFIRIRNTNTRCPNGSTCYVYHANTTGIASGSLYNSGTSFTFIPSFSSTSSYAVQTTVSNYSASYMNLIDEPGGWYEYNETLTKTVIDLAQGDVAGGYFYRVNSPTSAMLSTGEYYTSNGTLCTATNSCATAYKLIQYNDSRTNSDGTSIFNINAVSNDGYTIVDQANYYYLVTRDLNIFRYTSTASISMSSIAVDRPFTVTGTGLTSTSVTGVLAYPSSGWNGTGAFTASNDLVIENMKIYGPNTSGSSNISLGSDSKTSSVIYANSHNVKIGRNVFSSRDNNYLIAESIFGGTNTKASGNFKVIVESGYFYSYHSGAMSGSSSVTLNEITVLGSDYDRATNDHSNLRFNIGLDGYAAGSNTAGSVSLFASFTTVKSGRFGFNADGTPNNDNTAGMYIGGRASTCVNSITGAKIEGGIINTVLGGYGYSGTDSTNSSYIGMSGGSVRAIYGGAGHSTTKGNRIINVTGGLINYSILGGSDSYSSNDANDGIVQGSTLIYVGGTTTVGDGSTNELNGVESGSVFGAGGGNTSSSAKGTVYNSHVIIAGGTIRTAVYGGGNHGSTGTQSSTSAKTVVDILGGTIGDVFGGSKSAGFSKSNYINSSTIDINISGGSITNVYGGSDTDGTIYGGVSIDITGGRITQNVYGGGKGNETEVVQNVSVTIGSASVSGTPIIDGSVYGGSAFGVVNATSASSSTSGSVAVTVNNGIITGSVFGGGQGNTTYTPYVLGNINVTINGGDITGVFGGNDQAGNHNMTNEVHLNGGIVDNVYGGGNKSSVSATHVYLSGATVTNLYGGSNTLGSVTTTTVSISSGTVQNVYGGNNEGGSCGTTNVIVTGTAHVNGSVYGGGNQVNTTTTNVTLNSAGGTIPNVYGGGNNASVTTANITQNGVPVTNMFGGSNSGGTVNHSIITHSSGNTTNIYGGNNAGGNTVTSTINYSNGSTTNIYGGGNEANSGESNINISGGSVTNTFGGGNQAGLSESNIHVTAGSLTYVYGGSNNSGLVTETHILIDNTSATITGVFGGGNLAQVDDTEIIINGGTITNVYGGGNLAQVNGDTIVDINGGTITQNIYGGGNFGVVKGDSNVTITDATILGSAYAGGNGSTATLEGNTTITVDGSTVIGTASAVAPSAGCVFGGGNQAFTGTSSADNSISTVNIVGGTIYGNVYGGANTSVIYGNTVVNIGQDTVSNSSALDCDDIYIKGHIFGGGEANASGSETYDWFFISVTQGTHININGNNHNSFDIDGSFYGGGNASSASGDSYLDIKNYGNITDDIKTNISIQRVTYVTIDNSSMVLKGAIDRANDYDRELFSISRVEHFAIKNNTSLFFETGANLLEEFQSLTSTGTAASVGISASSITKNVDNRIYMFEGKNLNIAKDQQVTDYGSVTGMTFLGIFNYDNDHNVNTGIYSPIYDDGDLLDWAGTFSRGSYVLGKHEANHDITVNGFYSNFINEDTALNEVKYIEPTPTDASFYMWFIGENVIEYNVNLVASKYSTLGAVEAAFLEFSKPNTSFQILSFDGSEITSGVSLVDKDSIPRIASTASAANNIFGLTMEASNSGWLTTGKTSFYTSEPSINGITYYEGENSNIVPTMLFYLYHSKNLTEEKDLGTARISVMAITKLNALSNEIKRLVINVNMSTALFQTTEYEGAMTPGDKYELFTSTTNNITTKSKFSAYYSLYSTNENLYRTGYHRVLSSTYVFPENTKITMLSFVNGVPEYYYHIIDANDVSTASAEFALEGDVSYPLSMFTKMGSRNNNSNYDDSVMNSIYYDGTDSNEEFIFIVDFSDTQINGNHLGNTLLIEMRDSQDETIMTVLGIQHSQLTYNLYSGNDSQITLSVTPSDNPLYVGYSDILDVLVGYQSSTSGGVLITDTQYFNSKLGFQVYLLNGDGHVVSGTDLTGAYFSMDGVDYYPDINGYTHIKLSDKVGNAEKWIIFNTENASIATGEYVFVMETFGSPDGIYYSEGVSTECRRTITIINSTYGLKVEIDDDTVVFDSVNDKNLKFTITYTSMLTSPNIRIAMYRRKYDLIYDTNYELVDFQDYIRYELTPTGNTNEYMLINSPRPTNSSQLAMESQLLTGTYRLVFRLYDNDTLIGDVIEYIIIK